MVLRGCRSLLQIILSLFPSDGVPGSNTVSPDGEALSRFLTEGLSISPTSGLCFERFLKVLGINPALARCAHVIFSPFSP
jgi:hypothetical protein